MPRIPKQNPARPWIPERKPFERRKESNREVYNSSRWRNLSRLHKQSNPLCVQCEAEGRIVAVEVTDHITPINQGGAVYDWNNLQSLCSRCHNRKSAGEAHSNGEGGDNL